MTKQKKQYRTTTQRLARLKELAAEEGKNIYERLELADACLRDDEWVDGEPFQGDVVAATDFLEEQYFALLAGIHRLSYMLRLYRDVPFEVWEQYRFSLQMIDGYYQNEVVEQSEPRARTSWKKEYEELKEKYEEVVLELKRAQQENTELKKTNQDLREMNASLQGGLEQMEKVMDRQMTEAAR